jgi:hypothetical protein
MTGQLTHDANQASLEDRLRHADSRRVARGAATAAPARTETYVSTGEAIAIRRATEADRPALERLAALDSAPVPSGDVLIAEVGDEPRAAIEIASGDTIADPFRRTAHVVELVRLRAALIQEAAAPPRRLRLRLRSAFRAA